MHLHAKQLGISSNGAVQQFYDLGYRAQQINANFNSGNANSYTDNKYWENIKLRQSWIKHWSKKFYNNIQEKFNNLKKKYQI